MAVIGKIRKQSAFLVIIIGVALAAFVLGDFAKSGGGGSREINVGVIDGEDITIMDFNKKVDQNIEATKQQQNKERLTYEETFRLKNDTWKQVINEVLLSEEYEALGINVTPEELFDIIQGPNPHPLIIQSFTNPQTGTFDRSLVLQFLQTLDQRELEIKQQWYVFEDYIRKDRLRTKYNSLISQAYYIPTELAKMVYKEENDKASIKFVTKRYSEIADSLVNPTDADFQKAYDEQKEKFKQDAYRDFDYVVFEVKPSDKDLHAASNEMNQLFEEFKTTDDITRFVVMNSERPYDSAWKVKGQLPVKVDSIMFNSEIGTVVEPYMENDIFNTARLVDVSFRPDSMRASHILIAYNGALRANPEILRTKQQAEDLADSLYSILKKSSRNLESLTISFSDDPSAKTNKGDLDWFADGMMVTSFNEAVVDTKVGNVTLAESPFGYHIIKVTGKKEKVKKVRVAFVSQEVIASNETYQQTFAKASKLAAESQDIDQFNAAVKDGRMNRRKAQKIHSMANVISGLNNPRQIVLWSFKDEREVGDVSEVFDLEGQFVVAVLVTKAEEGFPPLEDVKTRLNSFVYNKLKGDIILEQMAALNNDYNAIAQSGNFTTDEVAALTSSSRSIKGYGIENEVIGSVFGKGENSIVGPIEGNSGVFLVNVEKIVSSTDQDNYFEVISKLTSNFQNRVNQGTHYTALEDAAVIEDNRLLFY